jgi:MFS family permease
VPTGADASTARKARAAAGSRRVAGVATDTRQVSALSATSITGRPASPPAAGLPFLAWTSVPVLILARVISGVSIGMLTATATAYLSELGTAGPGRPGDRPRRRAEITATAANLGGLGFGPLVSGFLVQYAGDPLRLPYLVFEILMLAGLAGLALVPETVPRPAAVPRCRPQRISVPAEQRRLFYAAGAAAAARFALSACSPRWPRASSRARRTTRRTHWPGRPRSRCAARPR